MWLITWLVCHRLSTSWDQMQAEPLRVWVGGEAWLSSVPTAMLEPLQNVNLILRLIALSRGCRGTQNFSLNQSASVWSSSFKAKLIPEERRLAESPEPVDWSSGMLGRRAGFEGGAARSVWSTHFWIWLWHLQQKNLRRQMRGGGGGTGLPKMCLARTSGGHFTWK